MWRIAAASDWLRREKPRWKTPLTRECEAGIAYVGLMLISTRLGHVGDRVGRIKRLVATVEVLYLQVLDPQFRGFW